MSTLIKKNGTWEEVAGPNAVTPLTVTKTALIGDTPIANLKAYKAADGLGSIMFDVVGPNINIPAVPSGSAFQVIAHIDAKTPIRCPLSVHMPSFSDGIVDTYDAAFLEPNGDVAILILSKQDLTRPFAVSGTFICEE